MNIGLILLAAMSISPFATAFAQTEIDVGESTPCFMNYTAGSDMWQNCGFGGSDGDWLSAVLLPFEWVTGGYFTMIIVAILVTMTYIKYHTAMYPLAIGIIYLPVAYFTIPDPFMSVAFIMAGVIIFGAIFIIYMNRTRDLS